MSFSQIIIGVDVSVLRLCIIATMPFACMLMFYDMVSREPWNWHGDDYGLQKTSNFGKSFA